MLLKDNIALAHLVHLLKFGQMRDTQRLFELKMLHMGPTHYPNGLRPKHGVKARADKVKRDAVRTAHIADVKYNNTAQDSVGPVEERLRSIGPITPFVFGAYGEVSEDVEKFVKEVALQAARKHAWRGGARDFNTAASCIKHRIKQDLSVAAGRARMELLLSRIDFVDAPQAWYGQQGNAKRTCIVGITDPVMRLTGD